MHSALEAHFQKNGMKIIKLILHFFTGILPLAKIHFIPLQMLRKIHSKAKGQINDDAFKSYGAIIQHSKKINSINAKWITGISVDYSPATYLAQFINIDKNANGVYDQYQSTDSVLTNYNVDLLNTAAYTQIEYNPVTKLRIVVGSAI